MYIEALEAFASSSTRLTAEEYPNVSGNQQLFRKGVNNSNILDPQRFFDPSTVLYASMCVLSGLQPPSAGRATF